MYEINEFRISNKKFNPYATTGGSVVAIAGEDFAIIGADTRLSYNCSILTRGQKKLYQLSDICVFGVDGFWGDALTLTKVMKGRIQMYQNEHGKVMSTPALAQMLVTILYYKRFFPYYVSPVLVGLDENKRGCVYNYDPIGHCNKCMFGASGTAEELLQPLLDNQIGLNNMPYAMQGILTLDKATATLKDAFISAAERDLYTGDNIQILTVTKSGISEEYFKLRED